MDVTPLIPSGKQVLSGYGGGGFKINNEFVSGSLLLLPDRAIPWAAAEPFDAETLRALFAELEGVDILLVGTGKDMRFLPPELRAELKGRGIALDSMATGAACRTYNVLLAEERRVAAALIAV